MNKDFTYHVYIFGDSHSKCFYRDEFLNIDSINIHNFYKSSVSMKGLSNPKSRLNYNEFILRKLNGVDYSGNIKNICVLKFGQVDTEYNYFFKLYKNNETLLIEDFYRSLISNYLQYVKNLIHTFPKIQFIINGINMPNLYDIQKYIKTNIGFDTKKISYENQFNNHLLFNNLLSNKCNNHDITYFDLTNETTIGNKIKPEFIGKDNHFSGAEAGRIYNKNTYTTFLNKLISVIK